MKSIILGSNSPRRKEILSYFGLPFTQSTPPFDEALVLFRGDPAAFAVETARRKAESLADKHPNEIILTADTVVYFKGKLLLKPQTMQEAHSMLKQLSGNEHQVYTGVCVAASGHSFITSEESSVLFNELTDSQIDKYHKSFYPLDKAGGYAIQNGGSIVVKRIEGCYYNVMGLPIQAVCRMLQKAGIDLWDHLKPS